MSELYEQIPPERVQSHLKNAELAFREATGPIVEPIIAELGESIVGEAVEITRAAADEALSVEDIRYLEAQAVVEQRRSEQTNVHLGGKSFGETIAELAEKRRGTIQGQFESRYLETDEK